MKTMKRLNFRKCIIRLSQRKHHTSIQFPKYAYPGWQTDKIDTYINIYKIKRWVLYCQLLCKRHAYHYLHLSSNSSSTTHIRHVWTTMCLQLLHQALHPSFPLLYSPQVHNPLASSMLQAAPECLLPSTDESLSHIIHFIYNLT